MNLKKLEKKLLSETLSRNQEMDIRHVMSILRFRYPLSNKKVKKSLCKGML